MNERTNRIGYIDRGWLARRFRFRLRSLVLLIAVISLIGGVRIEAENHRRRDHAALIESSYGGLIADHERDLAVCRAALGRNEPYDATEDNARSARNLFRLRSGGDTWEEQVRWHPERLKELRAEADQATKRKQFYQRRLLWPF